MGDPGGFRCYPFCLPVLVGFKSPALYTDWPQPEVVGRLCATALPRLFTRAKGFQIRPIAGHASPDEARHGRVNRNQPEAGIGEKNQSEGRGGVP